MAATEFLARSPTLTTLFTAIPGSVILLWILGKVRGT